MKWIALSAAVRRSTKMIPAAEGAYARGEQHDLPLHQPGCQIAGRCSLSPRMPAAQ